MGWFAVGRSGGVRGGWSRMSGKETNDHSIRRAGRSQGVPDTADERGLSTRPDERTSGVERGEKAVADAEGFALPDSPVTVEADSMTATLLGVPRVKIHDYAYAHRLDGSHERGETRPVAMFDIENTSDRPLRWQSSRTKFIGDDDYTYQESTLSLDPSNLGPGCHTRQVEVEPGRRARLVTMIERLPDGVEVAEIVHPLALGRSLDSERLVFSVP